MIIITIIHTKSSKRSVSMCYIKKNDQFQVLDNGMILFKNKTYALGDCKFEDESQTPNIIEEVEVDFSDTRTKPKHDKSKKENIDESNEQVLDDSKKEKTKKERKEKKEKKAIVQSNDKQDDSDASPKDEANIIPQVDASINTQPSQMELDMGLPFNLLPQTTQPQPTQPTQGQPTQGQQPSQAPQQVQGQPQGVQAMSPQQIQQWQQWQQMQMQMQQQMPQGIQMPNLQMPQNLSIPQVGFPSVSPQGLEPSLPTDTTKTTESQIPQEFHMLQDFLKMTGGNLYLAVALVIGVIFYKQWKVNQDKKNEQPSDAHSQSCDQERKDLSFKVRVLEDRTQTVHQLEKRIQELEDSKEEGGINLGFSEEIEEKIESLEKQLKEVNKKLNQANGAIDPNHTLSLEKPKREYTKKVTNQIDK